jgi:hypothetical protein
MTRNVTIESRSRRWECGQDRMRLRTATPPDKSLQSYYSNYSLSTFQSPRPRTLCYWRSPTLTYASLVRCRSRFHITKGTTEGGSLETNPCRTHRIGYRDITFGREAMDHGLGPSLGTTRLLSIRSSLQEPVTCFWLHDPVAKL